MRISCAISADFYRCYCVAGSCRILTHTRCRGVLHRAQRRTAKRCLAQEALARLSGEGVWGREITAKNHGVQLLDNVGPEQLGGVSACLHSSMLLVAFANESELVSDWARASIASRLK